MTVDELPVWAAYAEQFGPWWGLRLDYSSALIVRALVAANGGKPGPLADYLPEWGDGTRPLPKLLPYADGMLVLQAMLGRSAT